MPREARQQVLGDLRDAYDATYELTDQRIIEEYGGDTANKIVAHFDNGTCLYISIDSGITVAIVIDILDPSDSFGAELSDYLDGRLSA